MRYILTILILLTNTVLAGGPEAGCFNDDVVCKQQASMYDTADKLIKSDPYDEIMEQQKEFSEADVWYKSKWVLPVTIAVAVAIHLLTDSGGSSSADDMDSRPKMEPIEPMMVGMLPKEEQQPPVDPGEDTEEDTPVDPEEDEQVDPELSAEQVAWGEWNDARNMFDITSAVPAPMYDGMEMSMAAMKPDANYAYTGDIDGEVSPGHQHISDPKITLRVNDAIVGINAEVHWMYTEGDNMERTVMSRYGARLNDDGTFSSFSERVDGMPMDGNPSGFSGAFYDGAQTFDAVAGHVITPRVYGTYKAELE